MTGLIKYGVNRQELASNAGSALVGEKGTSVSGALALDKRKPRKLFKKLFDSGSGFTTLKTVILGDSLSNQKMQQLVSSLDRRFGGSSRSGFNTSGDAQSASFSGGRDASLTTSASVVVESGMYQYWPTGRVLRFDEGGSASCLISAANPSFVNIKVYYVKEPGAGAINLVVGGLTVAAASANAAIGVGVLSYTQAYAQVAVSVNVTGASVRVLLAHVNAESAYSGVDEYLNMGIGGLSIINATSSAQGRDIWKDVLADISPDFVTFEMDDAFGDGGATDAAFALLTGILDAACPYADKLIIASTPRASDDAVKLAASNYLKGFCGAKDASYLFFDSYYLMGSYADMRAIFGADDGTHPSAAAQAYAAEIMWEFLGLNGFNLGYVSRAVNDTVYASRLARGTLLKGTLGNISFETDATFGYDWTLKFPRTLTFTKTASGESVAWQFSGNTAVNPNVIPINFDFNSAGDVRKLDINSASGYEFTRLRKTDNPNGLMNINTGLIRSSLTRAQLLAINANAVLGSIAFCTDCTGGAQLVYARGGYAADWATVDGKTAI